MKIYLVMGQTGEYDDSREWPVIAYQDEALAETHMRKAQIEANRIQKELNGLDDSYEAWEATKRKRDDLLSSSAFDTALQIGYPGTNYYLFSIELATLLPVEKG